MLWSFWVNYISISNITSSIEGEAISEEKYSELCKDVESKIYKSIFNIKFSKDIELARVST